MRRRLLVLGVSLIAACFLLAGCSAKPPDVNASTSSVETADPWDAIIDRLDCLSESDWQGHMEVNRMYPFHNDGVLVISAADIEQVLTQKELDSLDYHAYPDDAAYTVILVKYLNDTGAKMFLSGSGEIALIDAKGNSYNALDPWAVLKDLSMPFSVLKRAPQVAIDSLHPGARSYYVYLFRRLGTSVKQLYLSDYSAGGHYTAIIRFVR